MSQIPLKHFTTTVEALSRETGERLRELLENKHIYQRVHIDAERIVKETVPPNWDKDKLVPALLGSLETDPFFPHTGQTATADYGSDEHYSTPTLIVQNAKLFCDACGSTEAHAPIWYGDIANEMMRPTSRGAAFDSSSLSGLRFYYFVVQCQACRGEPTVFLVKRRKWDLYLEGRPPMEQVEVPAFVPKAERRLYRDALVALHGGKTLAALFYLRAFIETFARRVTKVSGKIVGDELMARYSQTLPAKQRDLMPSLREAYANLSE